MSYLMRREGGRRDRCCFLNSKQSDGFRVLTENITGFEQIAGVHIFVNDSYVKKGVVMDSFYLTYGPVLIKRAGCNSREPKKKVSVYCSIYLIII